MINFCFEQIRHTKEGDFCLRASASLKEGECVALMGQSGSGKSTLLRLLAGLERAKGEMSVFGEVWQDEKVWRKPQARHVGFLFQEYALFEHLSVEENLLFVERDRAYALQLLEMVGLSDLAERNVTHLSGGQQQRVALCRALMRRPKLLLLDEPFSALDSSMRKELQQSLKEVQRTFGMSMVMATHTLDDAYALSDVMWQMREGLLEVKALPKAQRRQSLKVRVDAIVQEGEAYWATVLVDGFLYEVEVSESVCVGSEIEMVLEPRMKGKE